MPSDKSILTKKIFNPDNITNNIMNNGSEEQLRTINKEHYEQLTKNITNN